MHRLQSLHCRMSLSAGQANLEFSGKSFTEMRFVCNFKILE
jgi:hypothetical protein